uniref:peptide-methionine (S)-S-oxide reductase n=1 Tax=Anabas testudineus TaxID=64144 RepID=A0A7N5ZXA1_ANATE
PLSTPVCFTYWVFLTQQRLGGLERPSPACRVIRTCAPNASSLVHFKHAVNGNPTVEPFPEDMETIMLGVFSTQVGYTVGFAANPTYHEVCTGVTGHADVVRVVFSPEDIRFCPIPTEILEGQQFYYSEDYHQQYLKKEPKGYCGLQGTRVTGY